MSLGDIKNAIFSTLFMTLSIYNFSESIYDLCMYTFFLNKRKDRDGMRYNNYKVLSPRSWLALDKANS